MVSAMLDKVTDVLRAHNIGEASSLTGGATVMDKLIAWLAQRFDSDEDTVRREWEVCILYSFHLKYNLALDKRQ